MPRAREPRPAGFLRRAKIAPVGALGSVISLPICDRVASQRRVPAALARKMSKSVLRLVALNPIRPLLAATLERTENHIAEGDRLIARQKELIAELSSHGKDVTSYLVMLGRFQETQRLHIQHRDRLQQELGAA
jgi:hypothetical protein